LLLTYYEAVRPLVDTSAYLRRIAYHGPLQPTAKTLQGLQRAHLQAVPFENLDIALGREILLDEERFFEKIVGRRRGGFCYELNGLFAVLLRELGFAVTLLSARVADEEGHRKHEFDHLALRVEAGEPWLADVGFGDCFVDPLRLVEGLEETQNGATYRLSREGERWRLERRDYADWNALYDFLLVPRALSEFACMCHYHQTSPQSHFTRRRVCSRLTPGGRITLADMRLIENENGRRTERLLASEDEYREVLQQHFGVVL
jgi:N-hydroxyarylamine O-acetyltransferase